VVFKARQCKFMGATVVSQWISNSGTGGTLQHKLRDHIASALQWWQAVATGVAGRW